VGNGIGDKKTPYNDARWLCGKLLFRSVYWIFEWTPTTISG